jgi:hypothetical protein
MHLNHRMNNLKNLHRVGVAETAPDISKTYTVDNLTFPSVFSITLLNVNINLKLLFPT